MDLAFFEENYVWIIVGLVIIIMVIIGYFADKKDFGKKEEKQKLSKESKKENENIEQPIMEDISMTNEFDIPSNDEINVSSPVSSFEMPSVEENFEFPTVEPIVEETNEDLTNMSTDFIDEPMDQDDMFEIPVQNEEEINEEQNIENVENNFEDLALDNLENGFEEPMAENNETNSEELNDELKMSEETSETLESVDNLEQPEQVESVELENNDSNFDFPNIENLDEEIKDFEEDEDVWKF